MHQIEAEFTFAAAHRLPRYQGKCFNLHGHNYRFQVVLRGAPDPYSGIFVDFGDVEKAVQQHVLDKVDHTNLNDFIENPTAENIATWIKNPKAVDEKTAMPVLGVTQQDAIDIATYLYSIQ